MGRGLRGEEFIIIFSIKYGESVAEEGVTGSLCFWVLGITVGVKAGDF